VRRVGVRNGGGRGGDGTWSHAYDVRGAVPCLFMGGMRASGFSRVRVRLMSRRVICARWGAAESEEWTMWAFVVRRKPVSAVSSSVVALGGRPWGGVASTTCRACRSCPGVSSCSVLLSAMGSYCYLHA
jgi:hypothetical protein